jgi:hypothetical protein
MALVGLAFNPRGKPLAIGFIVSDPTTGNCCEVRGQTVEELEQISDDEIEKGISSAMWPK